MCPFCHCQHGQRHANTCSMWWRDLLWACEPRCQLGVEMMNAYEPTPLTHDELREANRALRESRDEAWAKAERLAQALRLVRDWTLSGAWSKLATLVLWEAGVPDPPNEERAA